MTRHTATLATPPAIAATTELGSGLVLPIAKALTHIMAVFTAITREWPMTIEDAAAELEEANQHFRNATIPRELMTADATNAIDTWTAILLNRLGNLQANLNPDAPLAESVELLGLQSLATETWQLLVGLDRELTGLENNNVDPGRMP